jgi:hypothetical protein
LELSPLKALKKLREEEEGLLALILKEITLIILMLLEPQLEAVDPAANRIPIQPCPQHGLTDQRNDQ